MPKWLIVYAYDWETDAGGQPPCKHIPSEDASSLSPYERALLAEPSVALAEALVTGLEGLESEIFGLERQIAPLQEAEAWLTARRDRRLKEAEADPALLRDWGLNPAASQRARRFAERLSARIDPIRVKLDKLTAQSGELKGRLAKGVRKLEQRGEALLARSEELRRQAIALDPKVEARFHDRPYSVGQS